MVTTRFHSATDKSPNLYREETFQSFKRWLMKYQQSLTHRTSPPMTISPTMQDQSLSSCQGSILPKGTNHENCQDFTPKNRKTSTYNSIAENIEKTSLEGKAKEAFKAINHLTGRKRDLFSSFCQIRCQINNPS